MSTAHSRPIRLKENSETKVTNSGENIPPTHIGSGKFNTWLPLVVIPHLGFDPDQQIREEEISLLPALHDLLGGSIAQGLFDGLEETRPDDRIVLRQNVEGDVLVGHAVHQIAQVAEIVNILGVGEDGVRQ